jgi:hypothetical protein
MQGTQSHRKTLSTLSFRIVRKCASFAPAARDGNVPKSPRAETFMRNGPQDQPSAGVAFLAVLFFGS